MLWIRTANYDPQAKSVWPCFHQPSFIEIPMSISLCVVYCCFNALYIEGAEGITEYEDEEWFGDLDDLGVVNEQSYMIYATADCTIELQGMPANPAEHVIYINQGWNRIGFPYSEEVEIAVALSEFEAEEGDQIEGPDGYTEYDGEEWFGDIETLVPGQGYMYFSNNGETKMLVIQTGAKSKSKLIHHIKE